MIYRLSNTDFPSWRNNNTLFLRIILNRLLGRDSLTSINRK